MPHAAVWPALALASGIAAGIWSGVDARVLGGVLCIVTAAAVVCLKRRRPFALFWLVMAGWSTAGAALGSHADATARRPPLAEAVAELAADGPLTVAGLLREDASFTPAGVAVHLDVETIAAGRHVRPASGGARLTVVGRPPMAAVHEWRAGRRVRVPATLRQPTRYHNDGVPDHRLGLARRGTVLLGSVKSALLVDVVARGSWFDEIFAAARQLVRDRVDASVGRLGARSSAIVTAVLIGDRAGLDDTVQRQLQEAGTYHVIAISGGNIAIFAVLLLTIGRVVRLPWRARLAITAMGLVAYGGVAGGDSSVSRAIVMALVYLAALALDHRSGPASALAIAATLILCATPLALMDAGFLLTFGATIAIVIGVPRAIQACRPYGVPAAAAGVVAASLASEVALLPIGAFYFMRVTFAGLALNLAAVPLMSVVQIGGLVAVAAGTVHEPAARVAAWVPHLAAEGLVRSAALVDLAPWVTWRVPPPAWWLIAGYYVLLAAWLTRRRWVRWMVPGHASAALFSRACLAGAALLIVSGPLNGGVDRRPGFLRVTVFDVGQGDATLIQMPDGRAVLVDTGGLGGQSRFDIGERVVAPAVWALGIRRLEGLVVSHGDPDHMGGAPALLSMLRPREVWEGIPVERHEPLRVLAGLAAARAIPWHRVRTGQERRYGAVTIGVLHPGVPDWERQRVRNDDSIVLDVRFGEVSVILPGDIGAEVERSLAGALKPAAIRVLKVAHHGSATSTSAAFLEALQPHIALVSCGRDNRYGHPVPAVLERLTAAGAAIYRTDTDGAVAIETDGKSIDVRTWRERKKTRKRETR